MKNKSLMLLMVAAGCGLVAMIGVQQIMSTGETAPKTRILVARTEIDAGTQLDKTNVGFKEWPAEALPEGAIQTEEEFLERALKHRVGPGQPILLSELGNKGEYGMQIQIPAGMRVVTYPVTATMTHSGLMKPGNFVDVSAVIEVPTKGGQKRTEVKPVLQCVQVFAVDRRIVGSEESKDPKAAVDFKNISFLVYPLQAQLLQLANKQSNGSLQFALRSGADKGLVNAQDLSDESLSMLSNSLLGHQEDRSPAVAPASEKIAVTNTGKPQSAFRSYLAPETPAAVTSVGDQASKRTWKIEIFQGDQREVQEIDWPEEPVTKAKPTSTNSGNPVLKLFNRREKAEKPVGVETKSTSLVRRKAAEVTESTEEKQSAEPTEGSDNK
ncbi:MAG: Flp pilus assembly protein CpaB [Schlesneria sp.]|nr:Flp pilus assembly protein CpaB [Schlesneria sp.]